MLAIVALKHFGTAGAAVVCRPNRTGTVVRIGGGADDHVRLAGCATAAELFFDGRVWRLRRDGAEVRRVADGDMVPLDGWHATLLTDDDADGAAAAAESDSAWLEIDGHPPFAVVAGPPALIGTARWCAIRVPETELPTIAIIRRTAQRTTRIYNVPGVTVLVNGKQVREVEQLADGDVIELWSASARVPIRFRDPCEEIDRLLGAMSHAGAARDSAYARPSTRLRARLGRVVGNAPDAWAKPDESAIAAVVAVAIATFVAVLIARW